MDMSGHRSRPARASDVQTDRAFLSASATHCDADRLFLPRRDTTARKLLACLVITIGTITIG
jgi:hypothetical protein